MLHWWWLTDGFILLFAVVSLAYQGSLQMSQAQQQDTAIEQKLARYRTVKIAYDPKALTLSDREQKLVEKLIEASQYLESIFWRQNSHDGLALLRTLESDPNKQPLLRYLKINAGPYDLIEENKPFIGTRERPPGAGFYPPDLTTEEFAHYLKEHPDERAALESPYTVIKRKGSLLVAVPYHEEYKKLLEPAAKLLREASELADDAALKKFLVSRADALLSDDYLPSDLDWLDMRDSKIDMAFAPYETYVDHLAGIKTAYEATIVIRDHEESEKLKVYQQYIDELQQNLPIDKQYKPSKAGLSSVMVVNYNIFRGGESAHGYQAVATNLPNDRRVHEQKGTKKLFFKNFMAARVEQIIRPIAQVLMLPEQAQVVTAQGYFNHTLLHEISHGLGPDFVQSDSGERVPIVRALGSYYDPLEEAKADMCGLHSLIYLLGKGVIPKSATEEQFASYLAGILRTVRFGTAEAHGRAEIIEFNYLMKEGAISYDAQTDKYQVNYDRMPEAVKKLTEELLLIEATGDQQRAKTLFTKFGNMPDFMKKSIEKLQQIPVDSAPQFAFPVKVY